MLTRETVSINLWVISKTLPLNKQALDKLHEIFILGYRNLAQEEEEKLRLTKLVQEILIERFKTYHDAWREGEADQAFLMLTMLENMLNQGKPDRRLLNARLSLVLNLHVLHMMKSVLKFRKEFEISDSQDDE